jgi:chorismate-pyruvate lyase
VNPLDELKSLTSLFPEKNVLIEKAEHVPIALVPELYRTLLAHDHHMTVTMEEHHDCKVDVQILDRKETDQYYCRKIILSKSGTDQVVQFGIVKFDFQYVTEAVKNEIMQGEIPLGRILINHNVLRHIHLGAILKITAGPALAEYLQMETGEITYGRLATIFCNGQPAVDLLEIAK